METGLPSARADLPHPGADSDVFPSTPADVSLKDSFDIYQKQSDPVHKLWAYFQLVSLAVLGYTVGSDKALWSSIIYVFIALSYAFFAVANQGVLVFSQSELHRFSTAVTEAANSSGPIGKKLWVQTTKPWKVRLFHSISILVVLGAIFATWHDKCSKQWQCPKPEAVANPAS